MELRFTLKDSEIFQAVQRVALRNKRAWFFGTGGSVIYSLIFALIAGHPLGLLAGLPILLVFFLATALLNPYIVAKRFRAMKTNQQAWVFEEKVEVEVSNGKSEFEWDYFDRAREASKWFFLFKQRQFYIFPKTQMSDAHVDEFRALLEAKGKLADA